MILLNDQRILITGANGGIGISIAETLLKNNAKLILFYNNDRTKIDNLLNLYSDLCSNVEVYKVNLLDNASIEQTMSNVLKRGKIDTFVHSVTLPLEYKGFINMKWDDFQSHIELQTKAFFHIVQTLIPFMKENKRGKIICILTSSTVGTPPSKLSHYVVGKYSLLGLAKSLSVELGPMGITVNCISPTMTNTPLILKLPEKLKELTSNKIPLGRLAQPTDVSSAVLFLCSKHSDFISGENLLITGGETMH